jgi:hypothetical protein
MSGFKKAVRQASKLRLGLIGPPGSGKTYTALLVATYLQAGRVAVIDTEHESASKYAPPEGEAANPEQGTFEFDSLALTSFGPPEYVRAIKLAEKEGYGAVVIDSLSHAWVGTGGALEMHDQAVDRQRGSKNTYTAWREVTPHHTALVEAMLQSSAHVIATCRAKVEYVQEKDGNGKTTVRKVGMAAVQREGLEYEFDVTGDLDTENRLVVGKTRCRALRGAVVPCPGKDFAETLRHWLAIGGKPEAPPAQAFASAAAFAEWVAAEDGKLSAEGLAAEGELLRVVRERGAAKKPPLPADLGQWPQAAWPAVAKFVAEAAAERRASRQPAANGAAHA